MKVHYVLVVAVLLLFPFIGNPSNQCQHLQRLPIAGLCTHGGDPAATCLLALCLPSSNPSPPKAPCLGDGQSGKRIQLFYGQVLGEIDDSSHAIPSIRVSADTVNQAYQSLGFNVRWVCTQTGESVIRVLLPNHDFGTMISTLRSLGYTSSNRIYAVMTKTGNGGYAGFGTVKSDDRPTNNLNDSGPSYSLVYSYSYAQILMHETAHNMGAVQLSAPHSSGAWHCYDEADLLCLNDGGPYFQNGGRIWNRCPSGSLAQELDCGRDDFWSTSPSGYLATHWNLARSSFLQPF